MNTARKIEQVADRIEMDGEMYARVIKPYSEPDIIELESAVRHVARRASDRACSSHGPVYGTSRCPECGSDDLLYESSNGVVSFFIDDIVADYFYSARVSDGVLREDYDQCLQDGYGTIDLGVSSFTPSEILKKCDPVAYDIGYNDYIESLHQYMVIVEIGGVVYYVDSVCEICRDYAPLVAE